MARLSSKAETFTKSFLLKPLVSAPAILSSGAAPVRLDRGFSLHVIPLRYASAAALREVVEPFIPPGRVLRVDADRNLFIFAGTGPEAADFTELVTIFDLDWMAGKSFGLFPLKFADPKDVATELAHVFGKGAAGLPAGIVDIVPIDRLSAVLVITTQEALLREARTWVERLDRGVETDRRQLFVYYVQNGRATELADSLGQAFAITAVAIAAAYSGPRLAPGLTPIELSQPQATTMQELSTSADTSSPADFASPRNALSGRARRWRPSGTRYGCTWFAWRWCRRHLANCRGRTQQRPARLCNTR